MTTLPRALGATVLALVAGRADAQTLLTASATALAGVAPSVAARAHGREELRLDRAVEAFAAPGPFLAYALPAALEEEACAAPENHRLIQGRIESVVIRAA